MPQNYAKPSGASDMREVETFIKAKYLNKQWVDSNRIDPVTLFNKDREEFRNYV